MKRLIKRILVVVLFTFPFFSNAQGTFKFPEAVTREYNHIAVGVIPQVELISIVQTISDYPKTFGFLMAKDSSDYKTDVMAHFDAYKNHPAVRMLNRLSLQPRMLNFSAPSNIMLYTDESLQLRTDMELDEKVIDRAGGRDSLRVFLGLLRDFAVQTSFNDFFREHKDFYQSISENTIENMGKIDYVSELENFYGKTQKSYVIVLVTLYNFVGYGNSLAFPDHKREIYNTMGPKAVVDKLPFFGDENYLKYMIRHEFSHPFINPMTDKHWDYIKDYASNYDSIPEVARQKVCGDWQECINEFIIRAVTTHIAFNESDQTGQKAYDREKSRGVCYLDSLLNKIKGYQQERGTFPSFEAFYPQILEVFKQVPGKKLL